MEVVNEANAERAAARAELDGLPVQQRMSASDVEAMVDSLGDMAAALGRADPDKQAILYGALRLDLRYLHAEARYSWRRTPVCLACVSEGGRAR